MGVSTLFFDTGTPLAGTVLFFPIGRASVKFICVIINLWRSSGCLHEHTHVEGRGKLKRACIH